MDKLTKELIEYEIGDLNSRIKEFEELNRKWFKFGKTKYILFLEKYIQLKGEFITKLESIKEEKIKK